MKFRIRSVALVPKFGLYKSFLAASVVFIALIAVTLKISS